MNCQADNSTKIKSPSGPKLLDSEQVALVDALVRVDDRSDLAVSRTRRRVYSTVVDMEEQRKGRNQQRKLAIVMVVVVFTLLAPAVWTTYLNFSEGAHFADLQSQISLLAVMLFPGIAAVATASYVRQQKGS